jgi:hypothetical protein
MITGIFASSLIFVAINRVQVEKTKEKLYIYRERESKDTVSLTQKIY